MQVVRLAGASLVSTILIRVINNLSIKMTFLSTYVWMSMMQLIEPNNESVQLLLVNHHILQATVRTY
jgi:hypothetical protein